ncbi:hypothetical protein D4764_02G0010860 [Takifugu flavidus]|uniref:Dickkopf N-terminal cysteine-rich domain-containing protein n=1 Tax=Takifugu flavidus TaxID=433684 RepID=A0A5C6NMA5_9TELE|nr:hypothetical protein D4764_02G0010860 [Takifugu flavidus]
MAVVDFGPAGSALRQAPEPPRIISALTSDYMSGQLCQNKRRAGGNVAGILTDCRKRQPPLGEKPATFHKQVPTCGPPGAGCSAARSLRRGIYPGGVPGALSGQTRSSPSESRDNLVHADKVLQDRTLISRKSPQYRYHSNGCRQMNNVLDWPPGREPHLVNAVRRTNSCGIMRVALLVLALTAVCNGILPEIVHPGVTHILGDYYGQTEQPEPDDESVEVEQRSEDLQPAPEDAVHPNNNLGPPPSGLQNETDQEPVSVEQEKGSISTDDPSSDLENSIEQGCVSAEDCGRGKYCLQNTQRSRCRPCKPVDVCVYKCVLFVDEPCTLDEECCDGQLCVWGQCSHNATRGEAGSTCQRQSDCGPDLCCAIHAVLLFPVCSAKPIERERCFGAPNHVMELLSWDAGDEGPRKHCPCVGDLQCQHLGRGSMCLKEEDSSEEDLADSLYSDIDYII